MNQKAQWIAKALGQKILAAGFDSSSGKESVAFLNGVNAFGDRVYVYIKLTAEAFKQMLIDMRGDDFYPGNYGEIISAGKGQPPEDEAAEMAVKYQLVDVPANAVPKPAPITTQPKVWGEE